MDERKSRGRSWNKNQASPSGRWRYVELVDVVDGVVSVRLVGVCGGCPMSQMTLKMGIERLLKKEIPEIKSVVSV